MLADATGLDPAAGRTRLGLAPSPDTAHLSLPADSLPADAGARSDEVVYGLLRLAGIEVALPLAGLREIVPCPPSFAALPAPAACLVGAMQLRQQIIPVIDLRCHLTASARDADETVDGVRPTDTIVAVVTDGSRMVGVLADRLRAVAVVPSAQLVGLRTLAEAGKPLCTATFRHDDVPGGIVSVLDVPAILRLPDVPTVADPTAALRQLVRLGGATDDGTQDHTLLRCGDHVLALHIGQVHTTLPATASEGSLLQDDLCLGVRDYGDLRVPVVDPLVLLGLGALPPDQPTSGVVLRLGGGYVVLATNALVDIVDIPPAEIAPVSPLAFRRADLLVGVGQGPLSQGSLVVDGAALVADRTLNELARLNTRVDGATDGALTAGRGGPAAAGGSSPSGAAQLVYDIGVDLVSPLEQVRSILPLSTPPTATNVGGAVLGIVSHQGQVVPVLRLTTLLGESRLQADDSCAERYALLVETGDGSCVAFAVKGLRAIEALTWQGSPDDAMAVESVESVESVETLESPGSAVGMLRSSPLVRVADDQRHLPQLDLRAVAATLRT